VDEDGTQAVRPGKYRLRFGVDGSAEGRAVEASLEVHGEPVTLFSLAEARQRAAERSAAGL
jgi:hypothetical protein